VPEGVSQLSTGSEVVICFYVLFMNSITNNMRGVSANNPVTARMPAF